MGSAETRKEALIIKTTIHDIMNKMIQVRMLFPFSLAHPIKKIKINK
jgi:hypothetical protein